MTENQYITLLRGINVGGNNVIKMTDLKSCFESMGFSNVITYIQSGNVLFESDEKDVTSLIDIIEKNLSERFKYSSRVVVVPYLQLKKIVENAPKGFGSDPDNYRYDVLFLKGPLTPSEVIKSVKPKEGVDNAYTGENVIYFSRLISQASQSHLTKIIKHPIYQNITIRNWNTTTKLLMLV
jgi:uncharacterized protein (DUF1697 family)